MEHLTTRELAELTAESVVGKLKDAYIIPMRDGLAGLDKRMSSLEDSVTASNGIKSQVITQRNVCVDKHKDVDQRFLNIAELLKAPADTVSRWRERAIGAGAVIGTLGGLVALIKWAAA